MQGDLTRVSNGTGQCNFSGQRDRQDFFCPGTKGQLDRSSFIVPGQRDNGTISKSYYGPDRTATRNTEPDIGWDRVLIFCHRGGLGPYFDSLSTPGTSQDKSSFWKNIFLEFLWTFFTLFSFFSFLGCPGTKEFVLGFLLLLLSWYKGTVGQHFFCPGTEGWWDKETLLYLDKGTMGCPIPWKP